MKYPITFKIYPDTSKSHYYNVYFFGTKKKMYQHYLGATNTYPQKNKVKKLDFAAICQSYEVKSYIGELEYTTPEIGDLLFYNNRITAMIVSHEATHAALYYMMLLGKTNFTGNRDHDEQLATVQGQLVRQIWNEYYKNYS